MATRTLRDIFASMLERIAPGNERYPLMAVAAAAFWVLAWLWLSALTDGAADRAMRVEKRYREVAPIVAEIQALKDSVPAEFKSISPIAATQQVARQLGLDRNLATIRPAQVAGGQEGVQVSFESLDLVQMLDLIDALSTRSGLSVLSCVIGHRMDKADLQMLLAR